MVWGLPVGLRRGGPVCWGVRLLVGCGANVGCLGIFGFLVWFGVMGGRPRLRGFRSRLWVLVRRLLDTVGMYVKELYSGVVFLWIARMVPPEHRFVCLLKREELWTSL